MKLALALGAVSVTLMISACGTDEATVIPVSAGQITTTSAVGVTMIAAADRGDPLVLSGIDVDGRERSLTDSLGNVTVVNFWATWCEPCRTEMPELAQAARSLAGDGVTFVGVNVADDTEAARAFTENIGYPSISDPDGTLLRTVPDVPPQALPITVILDREGRIAVRVIGPIAPGSLTTLIDAAS